MKDWIEIDNTNWEDSMDKITKRRERELGVSYIKPSFSTKPKNKLNVSHNIKKILATEKLEDKDYVINETEEPWYNDDWAMDDEDDIENYEGERFNNELSFNDFLNEAEIILVDNAFDFDINEWEKENQEEIDEELSEDTDNKTNTTTSQFMKYQLTPDKVKEIVNKIINSEFNIINYWKTNQFKKKNNLTDDDLKDILKTLTEQDYKTNSISIDNSKNEAIIFIKQTNIKNLNNIKIYIKLDYDSIENSPVIVLSFHSKRQKTQLTSSYKNTDSLKEYIKDEDDYLDKLNIKSNGVYSINTGWIKHPTQEDIPDIDMDEFEKEFKVWENRYFELLDELNENDNTLAENKKSKNKEKNKDKDIPKYTLKIRNTINYKEAIKSILTYVFDKKDSLITQIDSLIYDSPRVVVNKKFIDDIIDNITKGTLNNSKILMSMLIKLNSTIKRLPDNSILFARSKTRATHLKNAEVVFNPSSLNTSILELQLGNHKNNYRILYCAVNSTIILLTFRRKSSKKTEEKDIRDAETRCYENIILISNK